MERVGTCWVSVEQFSAQLVRHSGGASAASASRKSINTVVRTRHCWSHSASFVVMDWGSRALRSAAMTGEIQALTGRSSGGLFTAKSPERYSDDRQDLPALRGRGPHLRHLGGGGRLPRRPAGAARRRALLHRHPAAQRHRLAAYGACAQQHAAGRAGALRAHARPRRAVAARHRSRRHRHADGGRAPADGAPGAGPARDSGREKFLERVWAWKAESGGTIINQLKRLGASCDWSRERFTMDEGLSRAVVKVFVQLHQRGADLQGQAAGQLGPEAADRDLRPRSGAGRGARGISGTSAIRWKGDFDPTTLRLHHGRDHAAGDDARRHRGRGASRRRALPRPRRTPRDPAAGRSAHPDRRRRIFRSGEGHRRGQDHAGARLQRFRGRRGATTCR